MKVTTKDFQILEGENTFEFKKGINLVVGPNASGKSSLFYAIENCLRNPNGTDDCINYNHSKTEVTISNNNQSITWVRTNGSCMYIDNITGSKYVKASKLDSRDLANLGFYFDNKGRIVNIHNEWSVIFPFGESDTDMFRLFEDIFNISCSFQIIDEIKKDEQLLKSNITANQSEKEKLVQRLNNLNIVTNKINIPQIDEHINKLKESLDKASKLKKDYEALSYYYPYKEIELPELYDVSKLYESLHNFENINKDYENYCLLQSKCNLQVPELNIQLNFDEPRELRDLYEQYCFTKSNIKQYDIEIIELDTLKKEIEDKISQIRICPTCGRPLED